MLLVHYGEGERAESDVFLKEGMRAYEDIHLAVRGGVQKVFPALALLAARQQFDADARRLAKRRKRCVMLTRQNLGRREASRRASLEV